MTNTLYYGDNIEAGFYHSEIWQRDFDIPPHLSMYQPVQRIHHPEGRQTTMPDTV